jgi:hypothetical protein
MQKMKQDLKKSKADFEESMKNITKDIEKTK